MNRMHKDFYLVGDVTFAQFDCIESRYPFANSFSKGSGRYLTGNLSEAYQKDGVWYFTVELDCGAIVSEPARLWRHFIPF